MKLRKILHFHVEWNLHACMLSCVQLCDPMDCSQPGSSVHGISQARILKWVAISYSKGSSQPRDRTHVSYVSYVSCISCDSCIGRQILYHCPTWEAHGFLSAYPVGRECSQQPAVQIFTHNYRAPGLPWWLSGKESACQCRRCRFDPWAGKIPWRRKWQPTSVFLPGKSHGQTSLVDMKSQNVGHGLACTHSRL